MTCFPNPFMITLSSLLKQVLNSETQKLWIERRNFSNRMCIKANCLCLRTLHNFCVPCTLNYLKSQLRSNNRLPVPQSYESNNENEILVDVGDGVVACSVSVVLDDLLNLPLGTGLMGVPRTNIPQVVLTNKIKIKFFFLEPQ